jgi:hypothetical protein
MQKAISGVPLKSRVSLLMQIQKQRGNFSMPEDLQRAIPKEQFKNGMGFALVRTLRQNGLVSKGNGDTQLDITDNVPPEFGDAWLKVMKDAKYKVVSVAPRKKKSLDEQVLKEIATTYFRYSQRDSHDLEKKLSALKKTVDGLGIVVEKPGVG